jgi:hypothetical protein
VDKHIIYTYIIVGRTDFFPVSTTVSLINSVVNGSFLQVENLIASGLQKDNARTLYLREESKRIMKIMSNMTKGKPIWVVGCPGIGKSSTIFGYLNLPAVAEKGYLWIHFYEAICQIVHRKSSGEAVVTKLDLLDVESIKYLNNLVNTVSDVEYIVIDGVNSKEYNVNLFTNAGLRDDIKIVACTSLAAKVFRQETFYRLNCPETFTIESWTWTDYEDAFKAKLPGLVQYYANIKKLDEAYFYAGGSIRLMCSKINEMKSILDDKFESVSDYDLILRGLRGDRSKGSVNSLMQIRNGVSMPISQYILRKLSSKIDLSFIESMESINPNNPSWQGLVFEMKMIQRICKCSDSFRLVDSDNSTVFWPSGRDGANIEDYDPDTFNGSLKGMKPNTWYIPLKFNQGVLDIIFVKNEFECDIFQFKNGIHPSKYNFSLLTPVLNQLSNKNGNSTVNFYVVIPIKNKDIFKIQPANIIHADKISAYDSAWTWSNQSSDWKKTTRISIVFYDHKIYK